MSNDHAVRSRCGVTVLEVLVTTFVVGMLAALLLPAIQSARAAARGVVCQSRLKQLALASHAYAETHGGFVVDLNGRWARVLMPYFEDRREVLSCPADPLVSQVAAFSYCMNAGPSILCNDGRCFGAGIETHYRPMASITDGLSNTAAYSERLSRLFDPTGAPVPDAEHAAMAAAEPMRYHWYLGRLYRGRVAGDRLRQDCADVSLRRGVLPVRTQYAGGLGGGMRLSGLRYDHLFSPNSVGCYVTPGEGLEPIHPVWSGTRPATSLHAGLVYVAFADGRVASTSQSIDIGVWRDLGVRDGSYDAAEN